VTIFRPIHALGHVIGRGLRGMLQAPLLQLQAITTTSICMLLLAVVCLGWTNARGIVTSWGVDVPVAVYLVDEVTDTQIEELRERLLALPEVAAAERVTPDAAMQRLARGLGEEAVRDAQWIEDVDPGVLPETIEVQLHPKADPRQAEQLADWLETLENVDEVSLAGAWVGRVDALLETMQRLAFGVALGVAFACLMIVWSTIRLSIYARRTEIEILRLVGGTPRFVRGPFVVEGVLQGAAGAAVALGVLHLVWNALQPHLAQGLSLVFAAGSLRFFDPFELAAGVGFGALVGLLGSRGAVARYARA
jgi:cell division protein FtsX